MYVILTEKGLAPDGRMEYEYFGVKLQKRFKYRNEKPITSRLLKTVLSENNTGAFDREGFDLANADKNLLSSGYLHFSTISDTIRKLLTFSAFSDSNSIVSEMIDVFSFHFDSDRSPAREYPISSLLARFLEKFKEADLEICQVTPKRKAYGSRKLKPSICSNLSLAKENAMILMLLTGNTTYCDIDGEIRPIILDGHMRKPQSYNIMTRISAPSIETNPKIDDSIQRLNLYKDRKDKVS